MAATVDSPAACISLSKRGELRVKKSATAWMKGTVGLPHGWMYLTFKWFKTSKNYWKAARLINNIATGYNKNTKQMRRWVVRSCSHVRVQSLSPPGLGQIVEGLSLRPSEREDSEGCRPQWWLTLDTQSAVLWSESHCLRLATYQVCDITRASSAHYQT